MEKNLKKYWNLLIISLVGLLFLVSVVNAELFPNINASTYEKIQQAAKSWEQRNVLKEGLLNPYAVIPTNQTFIYSCPSPCPINSDIFNAKLSGLEKGFSQLYDLTNVQPVEINQPVYYLSTGNNSFCMPAEEMIKQFGFLTGYSYINANNRGVICGYEYEKQDALNPFTKEVAGKIEKQLLAVHEMTHQLFFTRSNTIYNIQESFSKAASFKISGDKGLIPPTPCIPQLIYGNQSYDKLVYLLCDRHGLSWSDFGKIFTQMDDLYKMQGQPVTDGQFKGIVDKVLGKNTYSAFHEIGWVDSDTDGDGLMDSVDNCVYVYNPSQLDVNANDIGDACDLYISDTDGDGIPDENDSCPTTYGTYCHGCPIPSCSQGYSPYCPIDKISMPTCNLICNPNFINTSWSNWQNISCLSNNLMNQSRFLIQYDLNSCPSSQNETIYEYRTSVYCSNSSNSPYPNLKILNPINSIYNTVRLNFNINSNILLKRLDYIENYNEPSKGVLLCTNCYNYNRQISFKDGFHNLTIRASSFEGKTTLANISFLIDSKSPLIFRTKPTNGEFTNGSSFFIKYTEDNLRSITLFYGDDKIIKNDCDSGENKNCTFIIDLDSYNNKNFIYNFEIKDIANNKKRSKDINVKVDTIHPSINEFNHTINGKYVTFNISIKESNFYKVNYIDWNDPTPRWNTLCANLKYGKCIAKKYFRTGNHDLIIQVLDKAGNSVEKPVQFKIE